MLCVAGVSAGASDAKQMEGGTIYFEVPESWGEITSKSAVYAHIWVNAGEELSAWQTKAEKMKLVEGRTFSYTIPKSPAEPDSVNWNMVIFSMYQVDQTYDLTMNLSCLGDTAYVTGNKLENPVDSNKTVLEALWKNNKDQGPHLVISSIGNIVGSTVVPGETLDSIIEAFVTNYPTIATEEKVAQLREELALILRMIRVLTRRPLRRRAARQTSRRRLLTRNPQHPDNRPDRSGDRSCN